MTELYNLSEIDISTGTSYFSSVNEILDFMPSIMFLVVVYIAIMYYTRENGIFKAQITASATTTFLALILSIVNMLAIEIMFIPLGLLILGLLLSVFVGER